MQPVLPLWTTITLAAIWAAAVITLLAIGVGKMMKATCGPDPEEEEEEDVAVDRSLMIPREDFVC